jgi:hypothetical protein
MSISGITYSAMTLTWKLLLPAAVATDVYLAETTGADVYVPITVALFGLIGILGSALIVNSRRQKRQLDQIHILVNSRLTAALGEIADLKASLTGVRQAVGDEIVDDAAAKASAEARAQALKEARALIAEAEKH